MRNLKYIRSGLMLLVFAVFGAASAFLLQVMMARTLSAEKYGYLISFYSAILIISPLAGFGVGPFLLRLCNSEGGHAVRWFSSVNKYLLTTSLCAFFMPVVLVSGYSLSMKAMIASIVFVVALLEVLSVKFQLEGNYTMLAVWQFLPNFFRFACVGIVCLVYQQDLTLKVLSIAMLISSIAVILVSLQQGILSKGVGVLNDAACLVSIKLVGEDQLHLEKPKFFDVVSSAWPFGISSFLFLAYFQAAIPLTGHFVGLVEAGLISVCITLLTAFYLLPVVFYQKALASKINFSVYNDLAVAKNIFVRGSLVMLLLGIFGALLLFFSAEKIVITLFGVEYFQAVGLLKVLAFAVPARYLGASAGAFFISPSLVKIKVAMLFGVAVFNVAFIFLFSYKGVFAIAYSLLISECLLASLLFFGSLSVFKGKHNAKGCFV